MRLRDTFTVIMILLAVAVVVLRAVQVEAGAIVSITPAKDVYVQSEPVYIKCVLRGLETGTPVNLTVSLEVPDGTKTFFGMNGFFDSGNSLWILQDWPFTPVSIGEGEWALFIPPELSLTPGAYVLRAEVYSSVTETLIDYSETTFYLVDAPYLDRVEPAQGITGDVVSLHGEEFGQNPDRVKVLIGEREATIIEITNETIHTWIPYGAITGKVTVSVDGASSNPVDFLVGPYIESVSKTVAAPGDSLDIKGFNFDPDKDRNYVCFNGIRGTVQTASPTQLKVLVPEGNTGPLTVIVNEMDSNEVGVTITPVVESIDPERGEVGDIVTIPGRNFSSIVTNNYVVFNAGTSDEVAATVLDASVTQLVVTVPAAETGPVHVYTDGQAAQGEPTFTFPPEIDEVSPSVIVAGDTLTITGRNFDDLEQRNTVTVNAETLTIVSALPHSIEARTPATLTSGSLEVTVNALSSAELPFVTVYPSPILQAASPSSLSAGDSQTEIVLSGIGFVPGITLELSGPTGTHSVTATINTYDRLRFKLPKGLTTGTYQLTAKRSMGGRTVISNSLSITLS